MKARPVAFRVSVTTRFVLALALLFVGLVTLRLHGFSLPIWRAYIDGSPASEVLLGQTRTVRWDDYAVQIPLALGQRAHDPPFPVVNGNVGLGQNMLVPHCLPVAHPATLFRPTVWGYFLGDDVGVSWLWWSQVLGVFTVWTLVLHRLIGASLRVAAAGGAVLLVTPYLQFWSLNCAPAAIYAGLCALSAAALLSARTTLRILLGGLFLGWAAGSFLLTLYPPYLLSLGLLVLLVLGVSMSELRRELDLGVRWRTRSVALLFAGGVAALAVAVLVRDAAGAIDLLRHSEYPGARLSTGGTRSFWHLMTANLAASARIGEEEWGALDNVCEASACWLVSPVLAAGLFRQWWREGRCPDALSLGLVGYCALLIAYAHFGVPEVVARYTGLGLVPAQRGVLGLTLAEVLLVVRWLGATSAPAAVSERTERVFHAFVAGLWTIALVCCGGLLRTTLPSLSWGWIVPLGVANGGLAYLLLERWRPTTLLLFVAAGLGTSTLGFNPLVRGGSAFLRENELSKAILGIDRELGGCSSWVVYGGVFANLLPAIGVRSLNGEQAVPQLDLWRRLDSSAEAFEVYNRYACIHFRWPPPRPGVRLGLSNESNVTWYVNPARVALPSLGATHILAVPEGVMADTFDNFTPLARIGGILLFELPIDQEHREHDAPSGQR